MIARPRFRQLGLGELLDESFRLFRSNFITFVAIAALVLVPYQLVSFALQLPFQDEILALTPQLNNGTAFTAQSPLDVFGQLIFWYLGIIAVALLYVVVFQPLLEGALTHAVAERYLGNPVAVGTSFAAALRRAPALIAARMLPALVGTIGFVLIGGLVAVGGVFLMRDAFSDSGPSSSAAVGIVALSFLAVGLLIVLTIVGMLLYTRIFFTSQTIVVERKGPWQSIKRSWGLTQGYFWRTVGFLLVITLLVYILAAVPSALITAPLGILGVERRLQLLITTIVSTILGVITTPFSLICYTLMYFDLRIRKEGFDIEQQTSAMLGADPASVYAQGAQW